MSELALSIHARTGRQHLRYLRQHLLRAHRILNAPLRELSLALVGDITMSRLHEQHMGIAGPTDVLTFPLEHDRRGRPLVGEVLVCVPEAQRQSRRRGIGTQKELLLYALHGMLHLSGYDDRTERQYRLMHRTEDMIFKRLGVGPIFEPAPPQITGRQRKRAAP
jgi:probable rRNA maturation factor